MPLFGFSQSNCSTAVTQTINILTDYQFQAQQTEYWLYFTADDSTVNVQLMKPNSSPWATIDELDLYSGNCNNLTLLSSQTISTTDSNLVYHNLNSGNSYYLKVVSNNSNSDYFGIYLATSCGSNITLNCPHPTCNLVPNGDFNTLGSCLTTYLANNSTYPNYYPNAQYFAVFKDPLNLTIVPSSANYDNVCGWAKSTWAQGVSANGVHPAIHFENVVTPSGVIPNYMIRCWSYSDGMEIFHTRLNDGNYIDPGKYQLQFDIRVDAVQHYLDKVEIYLSDVENTYGGNNLLISNASYTNTSWQTFTVNIDYTTAMANAGYKYLHFKPIGLNSSSTGQSGTVCFDNIKFIPFGITSNTPNPICEGDPIQISAEYCEAEPPPTITWTSNPNDPTMVVANNNINAYPSVTTTYTCTMNTTNGITASASYTVTVNPKPPIPQVSVEFFTNCNPDGNYTVLNYSSSYQWNCEVDIVGQNTINVPVQQGPPAFVSIDWNDPIYNMAPTNRAKVTVICTDPNTGCSSEYSFDVFGCCSKPNAKHVWNEQTFQNGSAYYHTLNDEFVINGVLTLDNFELTIEDGKLYMGGLSKINLINGGKLILVRSSLESCDQQNMWDGIYVNTINNQNLVSIEDHCRFQDAINNVVSIDGGEFTIINSNSFNKFYNGIIVNPYNGDHTAYIGDGNEFLGTSLSLYPYSGQQSEYGLYIDNVIAASPTHYLTIGDGTNQNPNLFENMNHIVYSNNSDIKFVNNRLRFGIQKGISIIGNTNNILLPARRVVIGGTQNFDGNVFEDNGGYQIINQLKTNIDIVGNDFISSNIVSYAVNIVNNEETNININSNEFNLGTFSPGIYCYSNSSVININENIFHVYPFQPAIELIKVENNLNTTNFSASTIVNDNTLENAKRGIWLSATSNTTCNNNTLTNIRQGIYSSNASVLSCEDNNYSNNNIGAPSSSNTYFGISVNNILGSGSNINGNTCSTSGYSPTSADIASVVGIFVESSTDYNIQYNNIQHFASGFRFKGDNTNNIISCNNWYACYHGVSLEGAIIGEPLFNNYFIGQHISSPLSNKSYDNEWNNNISTTRVAGSLFAYKNWHYYWIYDSSPSSYDPNNIDPPEMTALLSNQSAFWCGPPIPPPANPLNTTSYIAQQDSIRYNLYGSRIIGLTQNTLQNTATSFDIYNQAKHIYFGLKNDSALINLGTNNDLIYQNFIANYANTEIGQIYNVYNSINLSDTTKANNKLQTISPTGLSGLVANDVFTIYLKTLANKNYQLTTQDTSTLMQYAFLNTNIAGDEVYIARNLLGLYIVDNAINPSKARIGNKHEINNENAETYVYPNPTDGLLNITYDFNQSAQYRIELYDLLGRKLISQSVESDHAKIDINSLNKGTYIIKLYENSNVIFTEKVIKF